MEGVIAEVVLSVSLELLLKKLASSDLWKYARQEKIEGHLNTWKKNLQRINEVLEDAEEKQIRKPSVREWLADLRDSAYDVDDLLDGFNYEMTRRQLMKDGAIAGSSSSKVRKLFMMPSCCTNFSPRQAMRNVEMGRKMEEITRRLETISGQRGDLGLENLKREIEGSGDASHQTPIPPPLAHEAGVFGRDEDKKKIVAMLLNSPHDEQQGGIPIPIANLSVISIVAMGGMGKTTLADLVYNDALTSHHFSMKAWVCVSDPFDLETVTRQILSGINSSKKDLLSLRQVQDGLRDQLKGQRFLIVLDDVWTEDYDDWDSLRSPLLNGAPGSKILVTTRSMKVATMMMGGDQCLYDLSRLSEDDCWSVFQIHAFENRNVDDRRTLEPIGREIIKKCGGLPLAARALGGLLRLQNRESEWINIRDSKIWNLPTDKCKILPALTLSYTRLPSYLKRCFAYCAIFPKDYEFDKEELILLWMAEGLLIRPSNDDRKEMEDVGSDYFDELCSRSFFQSSSSNRSRYTMHDLINDLANSIAKDTCLHLDEKLKNDSPRGPISQTIRHSSIIRDRNDSFDKFERFCNKENLRTFIILPIEASGGYPSFISNKVVLELIPRMRHLRVLSFSGYGIGEIPDSLGELKHLRYLNLSHTFIECLPNSIGNLYNLQTLILSHCLSLTKLPISIGALTSLRCLDVRDAYRLKEMPTGIRKLEHLRILPKLIVGGSNTNLSIEDLRSMPALPGGDLRISILKNVGSIQDVIRNGGPKLIQNLETLKIRWESKSNDVVESNDKSVLGFLEPNVNLKELRVESYNAPRFPRWVNDVAKFNKMVKLNLVDCRKCEYLPCLGLLASLEDLYIKGMQGVKVVGPEFYGCTGGTSPSPSTPTFKALKSLSFVNMPNWEDWSSPSSSLMQSSSPCLLQLTIDRCPKLIKQLPACLPSLTMLYIRDSPKFEAPLLELTSLKELEVYNCNVEVLRSGIDLASLTRLSISGVSELINLQQGFVGFLRALDDLQISRCPEMISLWEDGGYGWDNLQYSVGSNSSSSTGDGHQLVSSLGLGLGCNLKSLEIRECERLERLPNGWHLVLTCLEKLSISLCPKLVSFPDRGFPPMLRDVSLEYCEGMKHLPDGMMMMITGNSNNINSSCRLECLTIKGCPSLTCFPKGQLPTTLKQFTVFNCSKLDSLPDGMMIGGTGGISCSQLEDLEIEHCPSLTCFPDGSLTATLKKLIIRGCERLNCLPDGMMMVMMENNSTTGPEEGICYSQLEYLEILGCPSLTCFPNGSLTTTLKKLIIRACEKLDSLPDGMCCSQIEYLEIGSCDSLTCFPNGSLPTTLKQLKIEFCRKLESLPEGIMQQQSTNPSLEILQLTACSSLTSFPQGSFPSTLRQLKLSNNPKLESISGEILFHHSTTPHDYSLLQSLFIEAYPNLRTLPVDSLCNLTSLYIWGCHNLEIEHNQFENLTRLTSLNISNCGNIKRPVSQWGLANLPSLKSLSIGDLFPDAASFSDTTDHHQCYSNNHPLLPPTLTSLDISKFEKLESLASLSLQTLTSLRRLSIWNCPKLRSILQREGVLPHTLAELTISGCPLVKESYLRRKGRYWPQVAHIPSVDMRD